MSIPQLYKEKMVLNELSEYELHSLSGAAFSQTEQAQLKAQTGKANRVFLEEHPLNPAFVNARNAKSSQHNIPILRTIPLMCAACAICAIVLGGVFVGKNGFTAKSTNLALATHEVDRIKGASPRLFVYKKSLVNEAVLLQNNASVSPHDVLQVSYVSGGARYGTIISVDGSGIVTQHYPDAAFTCGELSSSGETLLDFSYELDNAPEFERFIFLVADREIPLDDLNHAFTDAKTAQDLLTLDPVDYVPEDCSVTEVVLLKNAAE